MGGEGLKLSTASLGVIVDRGQEGGWEGLQRQPLQGRAGQGFILLIACPLPLPLQVSESSAGPRRLHSLSISSDTTADSFSSLNPEEVGAGWAVGTISVLAGVKAWFSDLKQSPEILAHNIGSSCSLVIP